jgi:hypothetical protein
MKLIIEVPDNWGCVVKPETNGKECKFTYCHKLYDCETDKCPLANAKEAVEVIDLARWCDTFYVPSKIYVVKESK